MTEDEYEIRRLRERMHKLEGRASIALGLSRSNQERMRDLDKRVEGIAAQVATMLSEEEIERRIVERTEETQRKKREATTVQLAWSHKIAIAIVGILGIFAEVKQLLGR